MINLDLPEKARKRFFSNVEIGPDNSCWEWKKSIGHNGYGRFRLGLKIVRAHILSYQIHRGPIPRGLVIDHICRNRKCVNPDHLETVTNKTNLLRGFVARENLRAAASMLY